MTEPTLSERLLALPETPPALPRGGRAAETQQLDVKGDVATTTVLGASFEPDVMEGQARDVLEKHDLNPAEWIVTGFRTSTWTMPGGEDGVSARYSFARRGTAAAEERPDIAELVERARNAPAADLKAWASGDWGFVLALGDMQYGKIDGDGVEGTLARAFGVINKASALLAELRERFEINHVVVAFLGDHVEGFVSQGGANVWRTRLTLNEQIRLVRLTMLHALEQFAPISPRLTMLAVPGNHGDPQRFAGKGVTTYSDSHDTEALVAVSEAARMNPAAFGHVEFFVPTGDNMVVVLDVAGTRVGAVHGHQFTTGKHFTWWAGQAFGGSPLRDADLLLAGHLHHTVLEEEGYQRTLPDGTKEDRVRLFAQAPALEKLSEWYRHRKGVMGSPGALVLLTSNGKTPIVKVIR